MKQKPFIYLIALLLGLAIPAALRADITWDPAASGHTGTGGSFQAASGPGIPAGVGSTTSAPTAFGAGQNTNKVFTFGFTNSSSFTPTFADTELSGTVLPAGTELTLEFTKAAGDKINFIAIVGDTTSTIRYEVISATRIRVTATIVNPVASASGDNNASFGLVIDYQDVPALDFKQTVFATDIHYFDIKPPATSAGGVAAINADGQNGTDVTFRAFLPVSFLNSIGLSDPSECKGYVDGIETPPGDFTNEGLDNTLGFQFMDAGNPDNSVLKVVVTNDAWSAHDIQFGKLAPQPPAIDPNIAKRAKLKKKLKKLKKKIRKAKNSRKKKKLKKKLKRLKRQLRAL